MFKPAYMGVSYTEKSFFSPSLALSSRYLISDYGVVPLRTNEGNIGGYSSVLALLCILSVYLLPVSPSLAYINLCSAMFAPRVNIDSQVDHGRGAPIVLA